MLWEELQLYCSKTGSLLFLGQKELGLLLSGISTATDHICFVFFLLAYYRFIQLFAVFTMNKCLFRDSAVSATYPLDYSIEIKAIVLDT